MKIEIKGNENDIKAFKEMLINNKICPFLNNEDVHCFFDITCTECIENHIDFIEQKPDDDPLKNQKLRINYTPNKEY